MRVFMLHNRYLLLGGEDISFEMECALLREKGCAVGTYEEHNARVDELGSLRTAARAFWSQESYRRVLDELRSRPWDLMHVQNAFPLLSPSVYYAAQEAGVPVVHTLRNFRIFCPASTLFRDGKTCEACLHRTVALPGIRHGCYRESRSATAIVAGVGAVHRIAGTWRRKVDMFIAPTNFVRQKFIQAGFDGARIAVKPNFVAPDPGVASGDGNYAVFVGRLSAEKGIGTLLEAWRMLDGLIPLKIVGEGPLQDMVKRAASTIPGVEWLGRRGLEETYGIMGDAAVLVFPSEWYETFGRVAVEAFARGTPVITTQLGAMAEVVDHGRTGLLYPPGDAAQLAERVQQLVANPSRTREMRAAARAEYEAKYTADRNFEIVMDIYRQTRARARGCAAA